MQTQSITVELQLAGLRVLGTREDARSIEVVVQYANEEAVCPGCGRSTWQVHQWSKQRKQDMEFWGKSASLLLLKRRFRCRSCSCGKVFTEDDPICGRRRRTTCRLRRQLGKQAEDTTIRTVARWHEVSEGLVQRSWLEDHSIVAAPAKPHVYLGLDGFCVRRPGRMWTGLWDIETRRPVAIVPGERKMDVEAMLGLHGSRRTVQAVCIDLSEAYRQAIRVRLPQAAVVADKFHVIALASRALHEVHGERRLPGTVAWLLQRGVERLAPAEHERLAETLKRDGHLRRAWILKEELRAIYRAPTIGRADQQLDRWIHEAAASKLVPFVRTAATLKRWRGEILNYWRHPITNALVEGKHNRVKVLKRRAYGYRNNRTFQLRILNLIHTH